MPVQAIVQMVAKKDYKRAFELIAGTGAANPDICPPDCGRPCEKVCVRGRSGRPVEIRKLVSFIMGYAAEQGWTPRETSACPNSSGTPVITDVSAVAAAEAVVEAEAVSEAARCLNCGCGEGCQLCKTICCYFAPQVIAADTLEINKDECVACGMCYHRCPAGNIEMERRIPFDIAETQSQHHQWISNQLMELEARAEAPDTTWYSHDEFWKKVRKC